MDFVTPTIQSLQTKILLALVNNLGLIVGVVVLIAVAFLLIKLAIRWVRKPIHYEIVSNGLSGFGPPTSFKRTDI